MTLYFGDVNKNVKLIMSAYNCLRIGQPVLFRNYSVEGSVFMVLSLSYHYTVQPILSRDHQVRRTERYDHHTFIEMLISFFYLFVVIS